MYTEKSYLIALCQFAVSFSFNKNVISNVVYTKRFWNNLHQIRSKSKGCKTK